MLRPSRRDYAAGPGPTNPGQPRSPTGHGRRRDAGLLADRELQTKETRWAGMAKNIRNEGSPWAWSPNRISAKARLGRNAPSRVRPEAVESIDAPSHLDR